MKKEQSIIAVVILFLSLLIPIPQPLFLFILGTLLMSAVFFLLVVIIKKNTFYPAPKVFSVLVIIILGLQLHFTKNLIIKRDYIVFGEQLAKLNYIISFVILTVLFIFNLFFTINFIYREIIKFDPLTDKDFFNISGELEMTYSDLSQKDKLSKKTKYYYSELKVVHKKLLVISISTGVFTTIQIIICFLKRNIILEPTIGNVVGFSFIMFITIVIIEMAAFKAVKGK